jgi:hypothetical protein
MFGTLKTHRQYRTWRTSEMNQEVLLDNLLARIELLELPYRIKTVTDPVTLELNPNQYGTYHINGITEATTFTIADVPYRNGQTITVRLEDDENDWAITWPATFVETAYPFTPTTGATGYPTYITGVYNAELAEWHVLENFI